LLNYSNKTDFEGYEVSLYYICNFRDSEGLECGLLGYEIVY